jgi:hypothetical protein
MAVVPQTVCWVCCPGVITLPVALYINDKMLLSGASSEGTRRSAISYNAHIAGLTLPGSKAVRHHGKMCEIVYCDHY